MYDALILMRPMNLLTLWFLPSPLIPVVLVSCVFAMFYRMHFPYISVMLKVINRNIADGFP